MPGPYAQRLRQMIKNQDHRVVLEFWANDIDFGIGGDPLTMMYLNGPPGNFTACHNVANTLVESLGTAPTITLVSTNNGHNFAPAVALVRNGGVVMEVKFHNDHSVCVISTAGDPNVEVLEAWAGAGADINSVDAYCFVRSVFEDHDDCRPTRGNAADALAGAAAGQNLAVNVGLLTRCVADACGINHNPFQLTVKYRALDNINTFALNAQNGINRYTARLSEAIYRQYLLGLAPSVRCRVCFREKPSWRITQGYWHHCTQNCAQVFCDTCGALRPRPVGHGYLGSNWTRHRQCTAGHTMTMF